MQRQNSELQAINFIDIVWKNVDDSSRMWKIGFLKPPILRMAKKKKNWKCYLITQSSGGSTLLSGGIFFARPDEKSCSPADWLPPRGRLPHLLIALHAQVRRAGVSLSCLTLAWLFGWYQQIILLQSWGWLSHREEQGLPVVFLCPGIVGHDEPAVVLLQGMKCQSWN